MTVSISKMSINYYLSHAATADGEAPDMTGYYTEAPKAPAGRWFGSGLAGVPSLADGQEVTERDARAIYEHQADPESGQKLGRPLLKTQAAPAEAKTPTGKPAKSEREGVAGFDLTFSPPKSVSTLWAMAGPELRDRLQAAHEQATKETLAWVESEVLQTRAGHGGVAHVPVKGMVASLFDHWDSRIGDPQLHTHAVIANRVQRETDGQWVTIDSYTLHRHVVAISELYNSVLLDRLHTSVGALPESRSVASHDPALEAVLNEAAADDTDHQGKDYSPAHRVELAGVPDRLLEEFSQRSASIEARKDELIADYEQQHGSPPSNVEILKMRQQATLENRPSKDDLGPLTLEEKISDWKRRALNAGHDPATVIRDAVGHPQQSITSAMITDDVSAKLATWSLQDASQRRSTFTRANVRASAERVLRLVRCADFDQRRQLVDRVVDEALQNAVELTPSRSVAPTTEDASVMLRGASVFDHRRHAGVYTTHQVMDEENFLIERASSTDAPSLVDDPDLADRLDQWRSDSGFPLSADQRQASAEVLESSAGVSAIIGPAGTGKTTTMSAITDAWQHSRGEGSVIGLAPSAVAAGVLADEIEVPAENVAKWLHESIGPGAAARAARVRDAEAQLAEAADRVGADQQRTLTALRAQLAEDYASQARYQLREGQLVIIDEASMVSTSQLAELSRQADAAGAKVLLVGDPAQLEAVDAGGWLGHMERNMEVSTLDQVWRFKNDWEADASLRLRQGDTDVLAEYAEHGRIHGTAETDAADSAYTAWKADTDQGMKSILIAANNATVAELNERAHHDRVLAGEVDIEQTVELRQQVSAGVGEVILARKNDRNIRDSAGEFVSNGTRLTIEQIHEDGSVQARVESNDASITLDADYLSSSTELGYSCTAHRAQGVTVDTSHSVVAEGLSRELLYVSMTRGKHANHSYVELSDEEAHSPDQWEVLGEQAPAESAQQLMETVVSRSTAEKSAHEVQDAEHGWAKDLGRTCHEAAYLQWAARSERTRQWVEQNYLPLNRDAMISDDQWQRLVTADPGGNHQGEVHQQDSINDIISRCQRPTSPTGTGPGGMLPDSPPATTGQAEIYAQVQQEAHQQVATRINALRAEQPDWLTDLETSYAPGDRQKVLEAVVMWRAVSDQDDESTALGQEPARRDYLRPYWDRLQQVMAEAELNEPSLADHHQQVPHLPEWSPPESASPALPAELEGQLRHYRQHVPSATPPSAPQPVEPDHGAIPDPAQRPQRDRPGLD